MSSESEEEHGLDSRIENTYPYDGEHLLISRILGSQPCAINNSQRENNFYIRCKILEQTCSLIMDSGSSAIVLAQ
uniref:Uncharacterized protein n=1 Tax=Cajanus cajan TaxID=3821 RepID=A0A151SC11_CAJCA|nr:hypothetical protein KK1_025829 [Cajanus cajan]